MKTYPLLTIALLLTFGGRANDVTIVRDRWGVAHVYADTEEGVFFGAGYATAQDRLFQMELSRRYVQGRLAEILGARWLESDKLMRTLGLYRHAQAVVPHLSPDTRRALEAYAAGVNEYTRQHKGKLLYLFDRYAIQSEPWTPADCVAAWMRVSERFDRGWRTEVNAQLAMNRSGASLPAPVIDESACVVSEEDFQRAAPEAYRRLKAKGEKRRGDARMQGYRDTGMQLSTLVSLYPCIPESLHPDIFAAPKASHAWVVSGAKSATGKPILESDPQIAVTAPSLWHEIHLHGGRYNVRGIGVAGAPGLLIGYNERMAWGATALGSDNADLFEEHVTPDNPNQYRWRDKWETMTTRTETIRVKGGEPVTIQVRATRHGAIVNDFLPNLTQDATRNTTAYALHYLVTTEMTSSLEGLLGMMRARDWKTFCVGLSKYRSPGLHVVYADANNNIGYHTAGVIPIRKRFSGQMPLQGWTGEDEWQGVIPFDELPQALNPKSGFIVSANHVPVGAWYPYNLTVGTGGTGDNPRSWRLRELLSESRKFSVNDFLTVHRDSTNPVLRDFLRLALKVAEEDGVNTPAVQRARRLLTNWDGRVVTTSPAHGFLMSASPLLVRSLRDTPMMARYGGGPAGVCYLLKEHGTRFRETGKTPQDADVRRWLVDYLQRAAEGQTGRRAQESIGQLVNWSEMQRGVGNGLRAVPDIGRPAVPSEEQTYSLPYQTNLEGFGSLDPEKDFVSPPLTCVMVDTIWSQRGNSYSHVVDLSDVDNSLSLLPPGVSEDPASPHFKDQANLWAAGEMHPAPLTRERVMAHKESAVVLTLPATFRRR
jgi:penicillin amidase